MLSHTSSSSQLIHSLGSLSLKLFTFPRKGSSPAILPAPHLLIPEIPLADEHHRLTVKLGMDAH